MKKTIKADHNSLTITTRRITKREKAETFIVLTTLALVLCWLLTK